MTSGIQLSTVDIAIVAVYLLFLASMGIVFKRFNSGTKDYFAGGFRMNWWLLGSSALIANFSCWTYTGAAGVAYQHGLVVLGIYLADVVGFLFSALWFAPWFRQLRVVTAFEGIRQRFGRANEQFFAWTAILLSVIYGAVHLRALAVILTSVFGLDSTTVIVASGVVALVIAYLGGNWAVAASDFVQLLLLIGITVVVAALALVEVGGVGAFMAQVPAAHWNPLAPIATADPGGGKPFQYDWLWVVSGVALSLLTRNNLQAAGKFLGAKDHRHARWSALIPLFGYLLLPLLWFVPPLAAHTIVPGLAEQVARDPAAADASYIQVCLAVLPQGLMGIFVAGMFSATLASMDVALNKNAAAFVKNFYQPILRRGASDRELMFAGELATAAFTGLMVWVCILMVEGKGSLFDVYLYLGMVAGIPMSVPMFLGMIVRRTPAWSAWGTVLFGVVVSLVVLRVMPLPEARAWLAPVLGGGVYDYITQHPFVAGNLITAPLTCLFFLATRLFHRPDPGSERERQVAEFFRNRTTPVDFEREVGGDNTPRQARMIGRMASIYGFFVLALVALPNPLSGRLGIAACAAMLLGVGGALMLYARRRTAAADAASGAGT